MAGAKTHHVKQGLSSDTLVQGLQQKLLNPFGRISGSPMLWLLDMSLIFYSLFLSLIRHVHSQTYYQNQVTNVQ